MLLLQRLQVVFAKDRLLGLLSNRRPLLYAFVGSALRAHLVRGYALLGTNDATAVGTGRVEPQLINIAAFLLLLLLCVLPVFSADFGT